MPELRSGARQPRSSPNPVILPPGLYDHSPALAPPAHAFVDSLPSPRRAVPRRRAGAGNTAAAPGDAVPTQQARTRVRTRATVAKEAAVGTTGIVRRGKATAKQPTRAAKPPVQARAPAAAAAGRQRAGLGRVKQPASRALSRELPSFQDPFHPDDGEEALEEDPFVDQDSRDLALAYTADRNEEMEEESAGRSAEKVAGAEEEGSTAPLPEKV